MDENNVHCAESALTALARKLAEQKGPLKDFDRTLEHYRRAVQTAADFLA